MRLGKIVLTGVRDVQDVSNAQSLNDMSIAGVMPVAQVEAAREDFIRVALSRCPSIAKRGVNHHESTQQMLTD